MKAFCKYAISFSVFFNVRASMQAQDVANYLLLPGATFTLPIGETIPLKIFWIDNNDTLRVGTESVNGQPQWFINGQTMTGTQDPSEGHLAAQLDFSKAIYTAPMELPKTNPVNISVRFHPTDTSKELITLVCNITIINPGNKWYVGFTYSSFSTQSDISGSSEHTGKSYAAGSAHMLIKGTPPDKDGNATINTEYDTIATYNSNGNFSEQSTDISRDINGAIEEKTIRNHTGTINHKQQDGIEFEYDPSPGGIKQLAGAGLTFAVTGKDQFWKRNQNGALVHEASDVDESHNIVFGSSSDVVKKTKYGFTIDGVKKEDIDKTDVIGGKSNDHSFIEYHVIISRRPIK